MKGLNARQRLISEHARVLTDREASIFQNSAHGKVGIGWRRGRRRGLKVAQGEVDSAGGASSRFPAGDGPRKQEMEGDGRKSKRTKREDEEGSRRRRWRKKKQAKEKQEDLYQKRWKPYQ